MGKEKKEQAKISELTETLQRVQAEFENYQKRVEREKKEQIEQANKELLLKLIPIIDNFELAIAHEKTDEEFRKGIELIFSQFIDTLKKQGLSQIEEKERFDPEIHEALLQEESDKKEGTILEIFQKGYKLHDKIIRQAKVKVSK